MDLKIGLIGAGNMGEAFTAALMKSGISSAERIVAGDVDGERLKILEKKFGIQTKSDNPDIFDLSDIVVLAVKPQHIPSVLSEIAAGNRYAIRSRKLVISIAAGVPIHKIESLLYPPLDDNQRKNMPIVRVMPNTPALVLRGMSGMSRNNHCTDQDIEITRKILSAMGKVIEFDERDLDAVTALSGSGPAYVFYFIEAMVQAGIELGIRTETASELVLETFAGAVTLLKESGETPESLRRKVTSPGGTTEAALRVFETHSMMKNIIEGIRCAAERSKEISNQILAKSI